MFLKRLFGGDDNTIVGRLTKAVSDSRERQRKSFVASGCADFSGVSKENLRHYSEDLSYYTYKTFSGDVIDYEEHIKKSRSTTGGLYPPDIVMLYYCDTTKHYPAHGDKKYPAYWWFKYGIVDVDKHLEGLEGKGFLKLEDGIYKLTTKGKVELKNNMGVVWAHQTGCFGGAWEILDVLEDVPKRMAKWAWTDKVWYHYNKIASQIFIDGRDKKEALFRYRNHLYEWAKFAEYEEAYSAALGLYDEFVKVHGVYEDLCAKEAASLGVKYTILPIGDGLADHIEKLREKAKKTRR